MTEVSESSGGGGGKKTSGAATEGVVTTTAGNTVTLTAPPENKHAHMFRDVWARNLEEEFKSIRVAIRKYPYIAMDTEFPGVVARPIGEFKSVANFQYQALKTNVNMLKIIQLGLTLYNEKGQMCPDVCVWQFNFKFNLQEDMFAQDSIDLLHRAGIQFARHETDGILIQDFGELLTTSGLVLQDNVYWLSFHSGYDFGYLLRTMTLRDLPADEKDFFELLSLFFPHLFDIKLMLKEQLCTTCTEPMPKGGLQEIADQLQTERIGIQHQAGSDSLMTGLVFFKLKQKYFTENWESIAEVCDGKLYGLSSNTSNASIYDYENTPSRNPSCAQFTHSQTQSQRNSPVRGLSPFAGSLNRQSSAGDVSGDTGPDTKTADTDDTNTTNSSNTSRGNVINVPVKGGTNANSNSQ